MSIQVVMSALGHKQTFAPQKAMSALPPIATAKADSCTFKKAVQIHGFSMQADRCNRLLFLFVYP